MFVFKRKRLLITSYKYHPNSAPVFSEWFCGLTRRKQPGKDHPAQLSSSSSQHWGPWLSKGRPPCCHPPVQSNGVGKCVATCVKRICSLLPHDNKVHISLLLTIKGGFPQLRCSVEHSSLSFAVQEHRGCSWHSWNKVELVPDVCEEKNNLMSHQVWSQTYKIWALVYYFNVKDFGFPSKAPDVLLSSTLLWSRTQQSVYLKTETSLVTCSTAHHKKCFYSQVQVIWFLIAWFLTVCRTWFQKRLFMC